MFKRGLWFLAIVIAISVIYFGITIYNDFTKKDESPEENTNEEQEAAKMESETNNDSESDGKNPFDQNISQTKLNDEIIQDYIHKMSHQKVVAEPKWGFYEITDDRINWLLEGLERTEGKLENKDLYDDILQRWIEDDFSSVDEDHNAIWNLQDGTIGEATGIMSEEEEEDYINEAEEGE